MLKNNTKQRVLLTLFLLVVAAGIYYPTAKIISFEFPSSPPTSFRFAVIPVDPYDMFRGRYLQLSIAPQIVTVTGTRDFSEDEAFVILEKDEKGFAVAVDLVPELEPGKTGVSALRVNYFTRLNLHIDTFPTHQGPREPKSENRVIVSNIPKEDSQLYEVQFPFNRFYMNEKLAPEAENIVRKAMRADDVECAAVVDVFANGDFTVTDLLVDGIPIHELLKRERAETGQ